MRGLRAHITAPSTIDELYAQITLLAQVHPAWQPSELKALTARERTYWLELARYEVERRQSLS